MQRPQGPLPKLIKSFNRKYTRFSALNGLIAGNKSIIFVAYSRHDARLT